MTQKSAPTINVMLVDDHKCLLWGLEKLIESESPRMHVVGKAHNRSEALAAAQTLSPDIILLDLDLNGNSSLDFLPELRTHSNAHILVLTGMRDSAARENAVLCGASGVVLKDQSAELLLKAIERVHAGELWLDRVTTAKIFSTITTGKGHFDPEEKKIATLTPKEREIIVAVVQKRGLTGHSVADRLHMSDHTLRNHLTSIYAKLEVKNRVDLVMYAIEHKLAPSSQSLS
jgi:two-component system, NarL family, nitrate/nitrite response regulator NarL